MSLDLISGANFSLLRQPANTMKTNSLLVIISCVLLASLASAQELKLVPEPRQVQKREGVFIIGQKTRLVINAANADEDRTAAASLYEEIEDSCGLKCKIYIMY